MERGDYAGAKMAGRTRWEEWVEDARGAHDLMEMKTIASWKPPHVLLDLCVEENVVYMERRRKHSQYVIEMATGDPKYPKVV